MVSALYSNLVRTRVANGGDFDTMLPDAHGNKYYMGTGIGTFSHRPPISNTNFTFACDAINVDGYTKQICHVYTATGAVRTFERQTYYQDASTRPFGDWVELPTRAEVDALNNSMTKIILSESLSVPKDSSATVTLPSKQGSFLCAWRGANAVWRGLALITKASTSDGVCTVLHSNMSSVSESGNVLTFTNQHSSNDQTYYIRVTEIGA